MTDFMAAMLNELMGPSRNALPGESAGIEFDHPDICRDFLVGFCFHEAFRNTKNDLGYCPRPIHDEAMKKRYRESKRYGRLGYEEKFLDKARRFHSEVLRKIEKNEERLRNTQGDVSFNPAIDRRREDIKERREQLGKRIEELMEEAQVKGEHGNVASAQAAVERADELTKERADLDREEEALDDEARRSFAFEEQVTTGNRQMQVCKICGCFMLLNDAQARIDDHLGGKLHIAYLKINEYLEEVEKEKEAIRKKHETENKEERSEREEKKPSERDRDRRDRERDRKSSRRSRSRSRDRRDRDRDRRHHHNGSDRRRSRSRDRYRRH